MRSPNTPRPPSPAVNPPAPAATSGRERAFHRQDAKDARAESVKTPQDLSLGGPGGPGVLAVFSRCRPEPLIETPRRLGSNPQKPSRLPSFLLFLSPGVGAAGVPVVRAGRAGTGDGCGGLERGGARGGVAGASVHADGARALFQRDRRQLQRRHRRGLRAADGPLAVHDRLERERRGREPLARRAGRRAPAERQRSRAIDQERLPPRPRLPRGRRLRRPERGEHLLRGPGASAGALRGRHRPRRPARRRLAGAGALRGAPGLAHGRVRREPRRGRRYPEEEALHVRLVMLTRLLPLAFPMAALLASPRAQGDWGVAYAPKDHETPKPAIVFLHGMWASPEDSCQPFESAATPFGFLVCPRANAPMGDAGPGYMMWSGGYAEAARSIHAALDAADALAPGKRAGQGGTLMGFSNGAYF